jgi:hypothetical protein
MSDYNQLKNAAILTPSTATDLGSDTNRYSNVFRYTSNFTAPTSALITK